MLVNKWPGGDWNGIFWSRGKKMVSPVKIEAQLEHLHLLVVTATHLHSSGLLALARCHGDSESL